MADDFAENNQSVIEQGPGINKCKLVHTAGKIFTYMAMKKQETSPWSNIKV